MKTRGGRGRIKNEDKRTVMIYMQRAKGPHIHITAAGACDRDSGYRGGVPETGLDALWTSGEKE